MKNILFVDATISPDSRTREIAVHLVRKLNGNVQKLKLIEEDIPKSCFELIDFRTKASGQGDFSSSYFKYGKQFRDADYIVIAAPYYDLSFPAVLKSYFEAITINKLTFRYTEEGYPEGLCKGKKIYYVTTSGGPYLNPEFSSGYVKALTCGMLGVKEFKCFAAENLDIIGADVDMIINDAKEAVNRDIKY